MHFNEFWSGLSMLNQTLFVSAAFFSVLFLWQMIAAFIGLGGDGMGDEGVGTTPDSQDVPPDTHETVFLFKLVSVRSILAFATLFSWASALYMSLGTMSTMRALILGLIWGIAAMVAVALILRLMVSLTHSGNMILSKSVGSTGSVYLDIPVGGTGEIRTMCGDVLTHIKARAADGGGIKSGTAVRVARMAAPDVVEVEPVVESSRKEGGK